MQSGIDERELMLASIAKKVKRHLAKNESKNPKCSMERVQISDDDMRWFKCSRCSSPDLFIEVFSSIGITEETIICNACGFKSVKSGKD